MNIAAMEWPGGEDEVVTPQGKLDCVWIKPVARMDYYDYTAVSETFEIRIPGPAVPQRPGWRTSRAKGRSATACCSITHGIGAADMLVYPLTLVQRSVLVRFPVSVRPALLDLGP